jgi:hypothetical protein
MTAARDRLFLLRPDWIDQDRPWFCMACAAVEGFLGYYPAVRDALDIAYLPYERPRHPVIDLLGEAHQNLPTLILAEPFEHPDLREGDLREANGCGSPPTKARSPGSWRPVTGCRRRILEVTAGSRSGSRAEAAHEPEGNRPFRRPLAEAQIAASRLRAEGVQVLVQNEYWGGADFIMTIAMGGFRLWAPEGQAAEAKALISELRAGSPPPEEAGRTTSRSACARRPTAAVGVARTGLALVLTLLLGWAGGLVVVERRRHVAVTSVVVVLTTISALSMLVLGWAWLSYMAGATRTEPLTHLLG